MLVNLSKVKQFTANGTVVKEMTPRNLHLMKGYKPNTLLGYTPP